MKKLVVISVIVVILIASIASFFLFFNNGLTEEKILANPQEAMTFCGSSPSDKQNDCYFFIAETLKNSSTISLDACILISDEGNKKNCIDMLVGFETNQTRAVEICNSMASDKNFREHCYGAIYANSNNVEKETELLMCEQKSGADQANCFAGIADGYWLTNASKSVEICKKITDESIKERCLNSFSSSIELVKMNQDLALVVCDSLVLKSRCYENVANALASSNPQKAVEVCKKIGDDLQISNCYGSVWFYSNDLTIANYDFTISMCNILTLKKDDCLNRIVPVFIDLNRTRAAEICKLMSPSASSGCLNSVGRIS